MLAECIVRFKDIDAGVLREVGDRFEVTKERLEAINGTKYGTLATEVAEPQNEAPKRRTTRRKAEE